ncbi:MAG: DNA replication and repair protein RecF, partial [Actinobacteria bacterium]
PNWAEVVSWGAPQARISMRAEGEGRVLEIGLDVSSAGRRTYRVNGTVRRKVSQVAGVLPSVLFTPDDLRIVKDSAERRRDALDLLGDQLSPAYSAIRAEYERTLRQRNALLKEETLPAESMAAWTDRLVDLGSSLALHRMRLFERLAPAMSGVYSTLSGGERLHVHYRSSFAGEMVSAEEDKQAVAELLRRKLEEKAAEERARRVTVAGPHRDDITFEIEGREARAYGSQGQQRSIALAWKLAEVHVTEEVTGGEPVLLLDDVMSELDESRRQALAAFVGERVQTIITTTNLGYFDDELVRNALVVKLG